MKIERKIQKNISLATFTTFKIGGRAKFFVEVKSREELIEAINWAKSQRIDFFILGGGSNILVNDKKIINKLIIKINYKKLSIENDLLISGAGADLSRVVRAAIKNKLTGLEWTLGIPGTIGGAVRGNASAFNFAIADSLEHVIVFDCRTKKFITLSQQQCHFSYKESLMKKNSYLIIWEISLRLKKAKAIKIKNNCKKLLAIRKNHPKLPSAGCVFKNLSAKYVKENSPELYEEARNNKIIRNNLISAGWIISKTNLPGKTIGQAKISTEHANFIVNLGQAQADNVIVLISIIKQKVRSEYNLQLSEEIVYLGF